MGVLLPHSEVDLVEAPVAVVEAVMDVVEEAMDAAEAHTGVDVVDVATLVFARAAISDDD